MSRIPVRGRRYKRVLLKLSGECFNTAVRLADITHQIADAARRKTAIAVVVGGGNILRGRDAQYLDRVAADQAGMLGTVINGIRLNAALKKTVASRHLCALHIPGFTEHYSVAEGRAVLARGEALVLSGGTGNPFFSTDSAAALRAAELNAEVLLKATNVAGVYSSDPKRNTKAKLYRRLSYDQALTEKLAVMDMTAFAFCLDRRIPVRVFDLNRPNAIVDIIQGKQIGSLIC